MTAGATLNEFYIMVTRGNAVWDGALSPLLNVKKNRTRDSKQVRMVHSLYFGVIRL